MYLPHIYAIRLLQKIQLCEMILAYQLVAQRSYKLSVKDRAGDNYHNLFEVSVKSQDLFDVSSKQSRFIYNSINK